MIVTLVVQNLLLSSILGTVPSLRVPLFSPYLGLPRPVNTDKINAYPLIVQVPVLYGAAIEGSATCLCRIVSKTLSEFKPRFSTAIDSFISTSLVVAGEKTSPLVS
jgi:hypothetical protein